MSASNWFDISLQRKALTPFTRIRFPILLNNLGVLARDNDNYEE